MANKYSLRSWLQSLPESEAYDLVRDLLLAMEFDRVTITHGPLEYGRDLVFREKDRIGREIWRGVQVKSNLPTGKLSGSKGLRLILNQCQAALDSPYLTPAGDLVTITEIWLLFTKPLTEAQKASAQGQLKGKVQVVDGAHFADLVAEYLPDLVRQRSGMLDNYFMNLIELSDQVNPYLSAKLGTTISLTDLYLPPLSSLALLRPDAIAGLSAKRLSMRKLFDVGPLEEFAALASYGLLPAAYHYQVFLAISKMLSLIEEASAFEFLFHADDHFRLPPLQLAQALGIIFTEKSKSTHYFYCGELKHEHVIDIALHLESLDRSELAPFRDYSKLRSDTRSTKREEALYKRDALIERLVQSYNKSIGRDTLKAIIPDVARLLFEIVVGGFPPKGTSQKSVAQTIQQHLLQAQHAWNSYADHLTKSFVLRATAVLGDIESCIHKLSKGVNVDKSDLATLAEARALTDLAIKHFDLPSGSIESREIDAKWLCGNAPFLLLEGDLGSGKTTLLRRVAAEYAANYGKKGAARIPVLCMLARVSEEGNRDLKERLLETANREFVNDLPEQAEIRWFLDGFDEIRSPEIRSTILATVQSNGLGGDVVLSSRPFAVTEKLPSALQVKLLPFNEEQVASFVNRFPWRDERSPEAMLNVIGRETDLSELATSPLLLTLMCILAQARGANKLPTRRASLYQLVIDLLLTDWDLAKGIQRERIVEDDSVRRVVLERVAYGLYKDGLRYFSKENFVDLLIDRYPLGPISLDLGLRLFADFVHDCIIVPAGQGQFGFLHYSVHEYLAALELNGDHELERVCRAVGEFSKNGRWEEVLVFYAGIRRNIGPLLMSAHHYIDTSGSLHADLMRLITKMLSAADFTRAEDLEVRGAVARVFAELKVGGRVDHWHRRSWP